MAVIHFVVVRAIIHAEEIARMCRRVRIAHPEHVPLHAETIAIGLARWLVARVVNHVAFFLQNKLIFFLLDKIQISLNIKYGKQ